MAFLVAVATDIVFSLTHSGMLPGPIQCTTVIAVLRLVLAFVRAMRLSGISLWSVCLLYTSPSPRDATLSRMPSSA